MSPRRNWESPTPSGTNEYAPPPGTKEGAHSPAGEGLVESQFRRLEKSLAPCLLCGSLPYSSPIMLYSGGGGGGGATEKRGGGFSGTNTSQIRQSLALTI